MGLRSVNGRRSVLMGRGQFLPVHVWDVGTN